MSELRRSESTPTTKKEWKEITTKLDKNKKEPVDKRYESLDQILKYSDYGKHTIESGYSHILIVDGNGNLSGMVIEPKTIEYEGHDLVKITGMNTKIRRDMYGNRTIVSETPTQHNINVLDGEYAYGVPLSFAPHIPKLGDKITEGKRRTKSLGGKNIRKSRKIRKSMRRIHKE